MEGLLAIVKQEEEAGPGWLLDRFAGTEAPMRISTLRTAADLPPANVCSAVVMLGRSLDPERHRARDPLLREQLVFVRTVVGLGVPYLGIGAGAQLLAWALRGQVLDEVDERLGPDTVHLGSAGAEDPLLRDLGGVLPVLRVPAHRIVPPARSVALDEGPEPEVFRCGADAYGVLPRVEMTPLMLAEELGGRRGPEVDAALSAAESRQQEQRSAAHRIADRLLERAESFVLDRPLVGDDDTPVVPT